jgi:protein O-GlcNAc transferase
MKRKDRRSLKRLFKHGLHVHRRGWIDGARVAYLKVLEIDPCHNGAIFNLGQIYIDQGQDHLAIDCYHLMTSLCPFFPPGFYALGTLYHKLGKIKKAHKAYKRACRLDPLMIIARYNLGLVYQELGRKGKARKQLQLCLDLGLDEGDLRQEIQRLLREELF